VALLFDHFIGAGGQFRRHGEAEPFRRLQVDDQLVFGRRLYREIGRSFALQDSVDVASRSPLKIAEISAVGDKTTAFYEGSLWIDRR
jgi:hypothetical protein